MMETPFFLQQQQSAAGLVQQSSLLQLQGGVGQTAAMIPKTSDDESSHSSVGGAMCLEGILGSMHNQQSTGTVGDQVEPLPLDVIFGRGQFHASRLGNIRFHYIIELFMPQYNGAKTKGEKSRVVQDIYFAVKESGPRFLKMDKHNTGYFEVDEATGKEKIGQAIRYKQRKTGKSPACLMNPRKFLTEAMVASSSNASSSGGSDDKDDTDRLRYLQGQIALSLATLQTTGQENMTNGSETSSSTVTKALGNSSQTLDRCTFAVEPSQDATTRFSAPLETQVGSASVWPMPVAENAAQPTTKFVMPTLCSSQGSSNSTIQPPVVPASTGDDEIISDEDLFGVLGFPHEYEQTANSDNNNQQSASSWFDEADSMQPLPFR